MSTYGLENGQCDRKRPVSKLTESFGEHPVLPSCRYAFTSRSREHICPDRAVVYQMLVQINVRHLQIVN